MSMGIPKSPFSVFCHQLFCFPAPLVPPFLHLCLGQNTCGTPIWSDGHCIGVASGEDIFIWIPTIAS